MTKEILGSMWLQGTQAQGTELPRYRSVHFPRALILTLVLYPPTGWVESFWYHALYFKVSSARLISCNILTINTRWTLLHKNEDLSRLAECEQAWGQCPRKFWWAASACAPTLSWVPQCLCSPTLASYHIARLPQWAQFWTTTGWGDRIFCLHWVLPI